jgi:hypothetical protein
MPPSKWLNFRYLFIVRDSASLLRTCFFAYRMIYKLHLIASVGEKVFTPYLRANATSDVKHRLAPLFSRYRIQHHRHCCSVHITALFIVGSISLICSTEVSMLFTPPFRLITLLKVSFLPIATRSTGFDSTVFMSLSIIHRFESYHNTFTCKFLGRTCRIDIREQQANPQAPSSSAFG